AEGTHIDHRPSTIDHRWTVTVPSFRVDVQREIDLIEEIARHDGYAGLPATFPKLTDAQAAPDVRSLRDRLGRQGLTGCGPSEAVTFSFIEASAAAPFADPATMVAVANPLSEKFSVMRPSLLTGLVDAAAHNRRREHADVRLFETGTRFSNAAETRGVAGRWGGAGFAADRARGAGVPPTSRRSRVGGRPWGGRWVWCWSSSPHRCPIWWGGARRSSRSPCARTCPAASGCSGRSRRAFSARAALRRATR